MPPDSVRVGGLVPFSTVDYPGCLSAVLFCQGCSWRCRYCHNPHLQAFRAGDWTWSAVEAFLRRRRGLLDAVVFSGGEPTLQPGLARAMRHVRALGFRIGLHTAGIHPVRLGRVLPLVDWVGLDIKAPLDGRYDAITGCRHSAVPARAALEAVLAWGGTFEIRTTVHPALLDAEACRTLEAQLRSLGAPPPRWQKFRPQGCTDESLKAG